MHVNAPPILPAMEPAPAATGIVGAGEGVEAGAFADLLGQSTTDCRVAPPADEPAVEETLVPTDDRTATACLLGCMVYVPPPPPTELSLGETGEAEPDAPPSPAPDGLGGGKHPVLDLFGAGVSRVPAPTQPAVDADRIPQDPAAEGVQPVSTPLSVDRPLAPAKLDANGGPGPRAPLIEKGGLPDTVPSADPTVEPTADAIDLAAVSQASVETATARPQAPASTDVGLADLAAGARAPMADAPPPPKTGRPDRPLSKTDARLGAVDAATATAPSAIAARTAPASPVVAAAPVTPADEPERFKPVDEPIGETAFATSLTGETSAKAASADHAAAASTPAGPARATAETTAALAAQIVRKLEGRTTRFDVSLTPEGLGRVDVAVRIAHDGALSAAFSFDQPQAALDVGARAGDLRQALLQAGIEASADAFTFNARDDGRSGGGSQQDAAQRQPRAAPGFDAFLNGGGDLAAQPISSTRGLRLGLDLRV